MTFENQMRFGIYFIEKYWHIEWCCKAYEFYNDFENCLYFI